MGQDWSTDSSECYSFTSRPEEEDLAVLASQAQAGFAYLQDSAEGVKQLHSQGVMHADIRPENTVYFKGPDKSSCSRGKYVLIDYDRSSYKDYPISRGHPAYGFQQVDQRPARPWHDWASIGMQAFLLLGTGRVWLPPQLEKLKIPEKLHTLISRGTLASDIEKIFKAVALAPQHQKALCALLLVEWEASGFEGSKRAIQARAVSGVKKSTRQLIPPYVAVKAEKQRYLCPLKKSWLDW
eukprot:m.133312 g.133312  ORF g.133312 m.133312 type:complete len:239 (-) comp15947_c0_seq9:985-1701(-)